MKSLVMVFFVSFVVCSAAWGVEIEQAVMTTAIEDRTPVDDVEVFPAADGQLYCFTKVVGVGEPTEIVHLWYRGEELMSRVVLPVRSSGWRTWSIKSFLPEWQGAWRVEVRDSQGELLKELEFSLL